MVSGEANMNAAEFLVNIETIAWLSDVKPLSAVLDVDYAWDWLPSSRDEMNPYPVVLAEKELALARELTTQAYKAALKSLRNIDTQLLCDGVHDYTEAFKGSALYCVRQAAKECIAEQPGQWTAILWYFQNGKWPCGVKENGELVVL